MNKKLGNDIFADSQFAIKDYMDYREENRYRHKAKVIVSSNGKECFNDVIYIYASIETNNSIVILEGNVQFERDFYGKYTNEYQKFKRIRGTLIIQAKDRWENDIVIEITGV